MKLKLRFAAIFIVSFLAAFSILNGRFVFANVQFWTLTGTAKSNLPSGSFGPSETRSQKPSPVLQVGLPDRANLVISHLGISAPLVFGIGAEPAKIYDSLEKGIVHYSDTPKPGQGKGASVLLGHSSAYPWYKGHYGSIFALLGKLEPGDRFYIEYEDGRRFTYEMKESIIFNPFIKDSRLSKLENPDKESVVLLSCWPVGTNYRRIAVRADLVTN